MRLANVIIFNSQKNYKMVRVNYLLDLTVMNSHRLYCIENKSKIGLLQFREERIREFIRLLP